MKKKKSAAQTDSKAGKSAKLKRSAYEAELPRDKVKLPKRQKRGDYREPDRPLRFIKEPY